MKHSSDKWRKSFKTWDHLVAMLAGQLSGVGSLREVEVLFDSHRSEHYHLPCKGVRHSTLADANKGREHSGVWRYCPVDNCALRAQRWSDERAFIGA